MTATPEPKACTQCGTRTAFTPDWTLWPWPDGAWLCSPCNDERHEEDDYTSVEAQARLDEAPSRTATAATAASDWPLVNPRKRARRKGAGQ